MVDGALDHAVLVGEEAPFGREAGSGHEDRRTRRELILEDRVHHHRRRDHDAIDRLVQDELLQCRPDRVRSRRFGALCPVDDALVGHGNCIHVRPARLDCR